MKKFKQMIAKKTSDAIWKWKILAEYGRLEKKYLKNQEKFHDKERDTILPILSKYRWYVDRTKNKDKIEGDLIKLRIKINHRLANSS